MSKDIHELREELKEIRLQDWLSTSDAKRLYSKAFGNKNTMPRLLKGGLFRWKRLGDTPQSPIIINHSDIKRWLYGEAK